MQVDAQPLDLGVELLFLLLGRLGKAAAEAGVAGVDLEILACLHVLDHQ